MNNRKLKIFIGICLVIGLFSMFKSVIDNEQKEKNQALTYEANITEKQKKQLYQETLGEFMNYVSNKDADSAWAMLDDECKKEYNNDIEEFKTFITTKLYNDNVSRKNYGLNYVKQRGNKNYVDVTYLIRFIILNPENLDYSTEETMEFVEYNTYDITIRDYSPKNYKILLPKVRVYEDEN